MDFQSPIEQIEIDRRRPGQRKIFGWTVLVVILIGIAALIFIQVKLRTPLSKNGQQRAFVIKPGERSRVISQNLYSQGLVSSQWIFDLYLWSTHKTQKIQAGTYLLSPAMNMEQIAQTLAAGKAQSSFNVLQFKEGWTLSDIENYLTQNNFADRNQFEAAQKKIAAQGLFGESLKDGSLEGYIFPDTYFIDKNATPDQIINKALTNLEQKLTPQLRSEISAQNKTVYEVLTMASIVEKEVGRHTATLSNADLAQLDTERRLVAGIFYKRLSLGMPLQSDATVDYITKKKDPSATFVDLQINSPYNTYKYAGLPPGPISNPSLSSIEAAISPQTSDYLYFLTKPDGTAVFAKTLPEQEANKQKYLK